MEAGIIAAIVIAGLTGLGLIVTLIVLVLKGGFQQGRLFTLVESLDTQVQGLGTQVESLATQVGALTVAVAGLQSEVQQNSRTLAALANHTHDVDGNTVFQLPPAAGR